MDGIGSSDFNNRQFYIVIHASANLASGIILQNVIKLRPQHRPHLWTLSLLILAHVSILKDSSREKMFLFHTSRNIDQSLRAATSSDLIKEGLSSNLFTGRLNDLIICLATLRDATISTTRLDFYHLTIQREDAHVYNIRLRLQSRSKANQKSRRNQLYIVQRKQFCTDLNRKKTSEKRSSRIQFGWRDNWWLSIEIRVLFRIDESAHRQFSRFNIFGFN